MVLKDMMLMNVLGSEGYCELPNYFEEGCRIVSTSVILATVWTAIRKKKTLFSAGSNNLLVDCVSVGTSLCERLTGGA